MGKICILLLALVVTALGQTSADLSAKYPHVTAYKVRSDVLMTARFAVDGQVCEMTLERRIATDSGLVLGGSFSEQEVRSLVDDLVPGDRRGRDLTTTRFNGRIEGNSHSREDTYENVIVSMYGIRSVEDPGYKVIVIKWPKRPCGEPPTAEATGSVRGSAKVVWADETVPLAGASVELMSISNEDGKYQATTDSTGRYAIDAPPGTYKMRLSWMNGDCSEIHRASIRLDAAQHLTLDFLVENTFN